MTKELEAFRDILGILSAVSGCEVDMNSERVKIVKQALQRLEQIDNANPSEAMECLKNFVENNEKGTYSIRDKKDLETIEQALQKAQGQEKENVELLQAVALFKQKLEDTNNIKVATMMMKQLDRNISLQNENTEYKKVLEIIKEKNVRIYWIKSYSCVKHYNNGLLKKEQLTQEEFELLKRWSEK